MSTLKTISIFILSIIYLYDANSQDPSYLEFSTSFGNDFMKIKNYSGEIYELDKSSIYSICFGLGYSTPVYKKLRFRNDIMFFETESSISARYERDNLLPNSTQYIIGWFKNQSILSSYGLEIHLPIKKIIFSSNIGPFLALDTKKTFSTINENLPSSLRSGLNLGADLRIVGKRMNVGLGMRYLHFESQGLLFAHGPSTGLQYSTQSLMARFTFSYKING